MKTDIIDFLQLLAAGVWAFGILWSISNHSCIGGVVVICTAFIFIAWKVNTSHEKV